MYTDFYFASSLRKMSHRNHRNHRKKIIVKDSPKDSRISSCKAIHNKILPRSEVFERILVRIFVKDYIGD